MIRNTTTTHLHYSKPILELLISKQIQMLIQYATKYQSAFNCIPNKIINSGTNVLFSTEKLPPAASVALAHVVQLCPTNLLKRVYM